MSCENPHVELHPELTLDLQVISKRISWLMYWSYRLVAVIR